MTWKIMRLDNKKYKITHPKISLFTCPLQQPQVKMSNLPLRHWSNVFSLHNLEILGHVKPNEHYLEDTEDDPSLV